MQGLRSGSSVNDVAMLGLHAPVHWAVPSWLMQRFAAIMQVRWPWVGAWWLTRWCQAATMRRAWRQAKGSTPCSSRNSLTDPSWASCRQAARQAPRRASCRRCANAAAMRRGSAAWYKPCVRTGPGRA